MNIFLSYGHDGNEELVKQLKADLEARGHDVWFDKSEIKFGDDWRRTITDGILASDWMFSFLSKHSTRDPGVCLDEVSIALGVKGGIISTILVENEQEVVPPVSIGHIQWLDMHEWKNHWNHSAHTPLPDGWYKEKFDEIVHVVESDASRRFAGEIDTLKKILLPLPSDATIGAFLKQGFEGRQWLLQEINTRLKDNPDSRVLLLTGKPGVGKSAFAAWLAHHNKANIIAAQFVAYNKTDNKDPRRIIMSIAFQIATRLPDYRKFLLGLPEIKNLGNKNAAELFACLLTDPLFQAIKGGRERYVILIDALDEASDDATNSLVDMIAKEAGKLPEWVTLVVTSRPNPSILSRLSHLEPYELHADDEENKKDLKEFLRNWRPKRPFTVNIESVIDGIIEASEGNFLYLRQFCNAVDADAGWIQIGDVTTYPKGMTGIYREYFKRQMPDRKTYEKHQAPLFELVLAGLEPLPEDLAAKILGWKGRDKVEALKPLGSLFLRDNGTIAPFHKSIKDWLIDYDKSLDYFIPVEDGAKKLSEYGWAEYLKGIDTMSGYFRKHLPAHLIATNSWDELKKYLSDPTVIKNYMAGEKQYELMGYWLSIGNNLDMAEVYTDALRRIEERNDTKDDIASLIHDVAGFMALNARYSAAESLYKQSLEKRRKSPGSDNLSTAKTLHSLAALYSKQSNYPASLHIYRDALEMYEKLLGAAHPETAKVLNSIAELYYVQARYLEAGPLYQRALEIHKKVYGVEHTDTAFSLNSLAKLYADMGKLTEAEPLYLTALAFLEKSAGRNSPGAITVVGNLATLYDRQGRHAEAETLHIRALQTRAKIFGLHHPDTAGALQGLANGYFKQNKLAEAEARYLEAFKVYEQVFGLNNPNTITVLNSLGMVYEALGKKAEAERVFKDVLALWHKKLGPIHPITTAARKKVADIEYGKTLPSIAQGQEEKDFNEWEKELTTKYSEIIHENMSQPSKGLLAEILKKKGYVNVCEIINELRDYVEAKIYAETLYYSVAQYRYMEIGGDWDTSGKDRVTQSYARFLLQVPMNQPIEYRDMMLFHEKLDEQKNIWQLDSFDKSSLSVLKKILNNRKISILGKEYSYGDENINNILSFVSSTKMLSAGLDANGFRTIIFGIVDCFEYGNCSVKIFEKEEVRTPSVVYYIVATGGSRNNDIRLRKEAFEYIFYQKWVSCFFSTNTNALYSSDEDIIAESIKNYAIKSFGAKNKTDLEDIKELFISVMMENILYNKLSSDSLEKFVEQPLSHINAGLSCCLTRNDISIMNEILCDMAPLNENNYGPFADMVETALSNNDFNRANQLLLIYLSDTFFLDTDTDFMYPYTYVMFSIILDCIEKPDVINYVRLKDKLVIKNTLLFNWYCETLSKIYDLVKQIAYEEYGKKVTFTSLTGIVKRLIPDNLSERSGEIVFWRNLFTHLQKNAPDVISQIRTLIETQKEYLYKQLLDSFDDFKINDRKNIVTNLHNCIISRMKKIGFCNPIR